MYDYIGSKIKGLAQAMAFIGIFSSVIGGIVLIIKGFFGYGLLTIVVGALISWISTWLLYGFGELIETTQGIYSACSDVALKMPSNSEKTPKKQTPVMAKSATSQAAVQNGWKCDCGRVNPAYQRTCVCGSAKQNMTIK